MSFLLYIQRPLDRWVGGPCANTIPTDKARLCRLHHRNITITSGMMEIQTTFKSNLFNFSL